MYDNGNDDWMKSDDNPRAWFIVFYGNSALEEIDINQILISRKLPVQKSQPHRDSICRRTKKYVGEGI